MVSSGRSPLIFSQDQPLPLLNALGSVLSSCHRTNGHSAPSSVISPVFRGFPVSAFCGLVPISSGSQISLLLKIFLKLDIIELGVDGKYLKYIRMEDLQ